MLSTCTLRHIQSTIDFTHFRSKICVLSWKNVNAFILTFNEMNEKLRLFTAVLTIHFSLAPPSAYHQHTYKHTYWKKVENCLEVVVLYCQNLMATIAGTEIIFLLYKSMSLHCSWEVGHVTTFIKFATARPPVPQPHFIQGNICRNQARSPFSLFLI